MHRADNRDPDRGSADEAVEGAGDHGSVRTVWITRAVAFARTQIGIAAPFAVHTASITAAIAIRAWRSCPATMTGIVS